MEGFGKPDFLGGHVCASFCVLGAVTTVVGGLGLA